MDAKKVLYLFILVFVIIAAMFAFNWYSQRDVPQDEVVDETPQEDVISIDNVLVPDQAAGEEVFVERVLLRTDGAGGYVAIHRTDESGAPAEIIGVSDYITQGVSDNFLVSLDEGQVSEVGETLIAMLHTDDGDQIWTAETDTPITDENGDIVMVAFTILAEEDIPGFETKL